MFVYIVYMHKTIQFDSMLTDINIYTLSIVIFQQNLLQYKFQPHAK